MGEFAGGLLRLGAERLADFRAVDAFQADGQFLAVLQDAEGVTVGGVGDLGGVLFRRPGAWQHDQHRNKGTERHHFTPGHKHAAPQMDALRRRAEPALPAGCVPLS
jgi:hypothetical protein